MMYRVVAGVDEPSAVYSACVSFTMFKIVVLAGAPIFAGVIASLPPA
jgi:hypothetical protein